MMMEEGGNPSTSREYLGKAKRKGGSKRNKRAKQSKPK